MRIYRREAYLEKMRPFYHDDMIKVITGVRRCGKSCLMQSVRDELLESGIDAQDIVYLDLDRRGFRGIKTPEALEQAIAQRMGSGSRTYIFIDEVQNVAGFEEVVNAFREEDGCSIFLTGSNSYLLSGELTTKLTGRYIEFELFTLSFHEYLEMKRFLGTEPGAISDEFETYLRYGGFPKSLSYDSVDAKQVYVGDVVRQIVRKDIRQRAKIRNVDTFERVMNYVINNFGATTSVGSITSYFNDVEHVPLTRETVKRYLTLLENAKLVEKCTRFDMKSRRSLGAREKYYVSDLGIYFSRNTDNRINYGPALENALYVYLRSRGYALSIGKIGALECDFIARKHNSYAYIQVAMTIADRATEEREYRPFSHVRDNYPQYLFTLDTLLQERDGITHENIAQFMAQGKDLT